VVLAVTSEPLSGCISLLTGNFTGDFEVFGSRSRMAPYGILHNSRRLALPWGPSRLTKNREVFRDIRELKFPVTGSSSENLFFFPVTLSRKTSEIPTT